VRRKWRYDLATIGSLIVILTAQYAAVAHAFPIWSPLVLLALFWTVLGRLSRTHHSRIAAMLRSQYRDAEVRRKFPDVWAIVAGHAKAVGIGMPEVYLMLRIAPAACAWGSVGIKGVGIRTSLVRSMPTRLVSGMLAHEVAHLKNRDELVFHGISALAEAVYYVNVWALFAVIVRAFIRLAEAHPSPFGSGSLAVVLAVVVTGAIVIAGHYRWLPRLLQQHEYAADALGAVITGDPQAAALGLIALEVKEGGLEAFIERPDDGTLRTHPSLRQRVNALAELAFAMQREKPPP
jgi:heat shock protein HtpX